MPEVEAGQTTSNADMPCYYCGELTLQGDSYVRIARSLAKEPWYVAIDACERCCDLIGNWRASSWRHPISRPGLVGEHKGVYR